ncbi:asialoglycoprotein receptor 2 [Danio rerio]|uniref:Asialoglycoprotein receptor 2 n=1 Tax=Danio rerio TaxID=7955 RepID=A0AB32TVV3_DANRE
MRRGWSLFFNFKNQPLILVPLFLLSQNMEMHSSEEYMKMEVECETKQSLCKGRPCSKQTGILVLLGTVGMIIFLVLISIIVQAKKLSDIETLMTDLSSSLDSLTSKHEENQQKLERQQNVSYIQVKKQMDTVRASVSSIMSKLKADSVRTSFMFRHPLERFLIEHSSEELESGCSDSAWVPFGNSCYLFSRDKMNWTEAKDYCEEKGAWLLKIEDDSEDEWQFVTDFANPTHYWIGLTDQNTGQWRWADGTNYTMNKEHWGPGQPDEWTEHSLGEEGEDCAEITYESLLNDLHCSSKIKFICEMKT